VSKTLTIDEVYAFVAIDEDGDEGVCAFYGPTGWMPMVCADQARVDQMRPIAEEIARQGGKPIQLFKFSKKELVEVFNPGAIN
jgi:hypothetical protein